MPNARPGDAHSGSGQHAGIDGGGAAWTDPAQAVGELSAAVLELEYTLIPHGLHVVGETPSADQRVEMLQAVADASHDARPDKSTLEDVGKGRTPEALAGMDGRFPCALQELAGDGSYAAGGPRDPGDPACTRRPLHSARAGWRSLRTPAILPTRRNLHGFDPFRIPSVFAIQDGAQQAQRLIDRHRRRPPDTGVGRDRAVGDGQSEKRGRSDRAGARVDGRSPASTAMGG